MLSVSKSRILKSHIKNIENALQFINVPLDKIKKIPIMLFEIRQQMLIHFIFRSIL